MAFIRDSQLQPTTQFISTLRQACQDYSQFLTCIVKPAKDDLQAKVRRNEVKLHHAFGANLVLAHSVDYILAVRSADGIVENRKDLVATFDERFSVAGAYLSNRKMELVDAINNAVKHIRLDPKRYKHVEERYGQISFQSLVEHEGRVMCNLGRYRFDYCRVVLLPTLGALSHCEFDSIEDVLEFARGGFVVMDESYPSDIFDPDDHSTAIDQLIELCSPPCRNCEEAADECRCSQYVFDGKHGHFEPLYAASATEFDELLNLISPSYSRA